jgi:hypothetical protein
MTQTPRTQSQRSFAAIAAALAVVVTVGLTIVATKAGPASASTPCYTKVINDWFDNGKIDHVYPHRCYTQAIAHLPTDVGTYSNAPDDIRAAMLAALNHKNNSTPPSSHSGTAPRNVQSTPPTSAATTSAQDPAKKGVILRAIEWLGPSDAAAVPLPLLVLAGVAFLLLAAAGGSLLNRHLQARRLQPPPQA